MQTIRRPAGLVTLGLLRVGWRPDTGDAIWGAASQSTFEWLISRARPAGLHLGGAPGCRRTVGVARPARLARPQHEWRRRHRLPASRRRPEGSTRVRAGPLARAFEWVGGVRTIC